MKELTERQAEILDFIRRYSQGNGYAPAVREISQEFGLTLKTVQDHLAALERKGAVKRTNGVARSIVICEKP